MTPKISLPPEKTGEIGPKKLVLIRHAHRDTTERDADNGLSAKGRRQAYELGEHFKKHLPGSRPLLIASPKVRCVETLEPIGAVSGSPVKTSPLLLEQGAREPVESILARAREFARWWLLEGPSLTLICSHGDYLPAVAETLTGTRLELKKGAWAEISMHRGTPLLTWLIQGFGRN